MFLSSLVRPHSLYNLKLAVTLMPSHGHCVCMPAYLSWTCAYMLCWIRFMCEFDRASGRMRVDITAWQCLLEIIETVKYFC